MYYFNSKKHFEAHGLLTTQAFIDQLNRLYYSAFLRTKYFFTKKSAWSRSNVIHVHGFDHDVAPQDHQKKFPAKFELLMPHRD